MSDESRRVTRKQLSEFIVDQRTLRAMEQISIAVSDLIPRDVDALYRLSQEASIDAGIAGTKAAAAVDALLQLARNVEDLIASPNHGIEALEAVGALAKNVEYLIAAPDRGLEAIESIRALSKNIETLIAAPTNLSGEAIDSLKRLSNSLDSVVANPSDGGVHAIDLLKRIERHLEVMASDPQYNLPRSFSVDYLDFSQSPPHTEQTRRLAWDDAEDTLNLHHSGGVVQQVGQELYGYFLNNIGSAVTNGQVIGFDASANTFVKYIANGTLPTELVIGIATQDIPNGQYGRATIWGRVRGLDTTGTPFGETWVAGDLLYVSTTVAGGFTKVKPTAPNQCIPIALVRVVSSTVGEIAARPIIEQQLYYGTFEKTTDQTPAAANTAYAITWDGVQIADGVSIGTPTSRIVIAHSGLYKFNVSFQLTSSSASVKNVWLWFRKNGVDVANTAMVTSMDSATAIRTPSRAYTFSLQAGDYVELMFASDSTAMTLDNIAATAFAPAAPAALLVVNQEQQ